MRILPSLAALLLGVAAALLVACGDDGRIPASDASRVTNALDDVAADFRAGNCQAAQQAVVRARGALLNLPDSVDARLRARLRSGVSKLAEDVPAACGRSQSQTQPAEPTQTDKTDTETSTTDTSTTDTETQPTDSTGTGTGGTPTGTTPGPTTGTTTGGTDTQTGGTPPDGGTTP